MVEEKKKRGGKREGAGRKKTTCKSLAFRVPEDVLAIIEQAGGNKSEFICKAIREYAKNCVE